MYIKLIKYEHTQRKIHQIQNLMEMDYWFLKILSLPNLRFSSQSAFLNQQFTIDFEANSFEGLNLKSLGLLTIEFSFSLFF